MARPSSTREADILIIGIWTRDLSERTDVVCYLTNHDALRVHQAEVAQVVQPAVAEDLGPGLEPHGLAELDAVAGQQLWEDAAEGAEHGPPGVDHLQLAVLGEGLGVGGEPGGVPAVVAGELAGQVGGSLAGEGAQVLDAVRAVPRAAGGGRLGLGGGLPHADRRGLW